VAIVTGGLLGLFASVASAEINHDKPQSDSLRDAPAFYE
jgi:hypothetical protein